jgi:hypothetical protein
MESTAMQSTKYPNVSRTADGCWGFTISCYGPSQFFGGFRTEKAAARFYRRELRSFRDSRRVVAACYQLHAVGPEVSEAISATTAAGHQAATALLLEAYERSARSCSMTTEMWRRCAVVNRDLREAEEALAEYPVVSDGE